MYLPRTLRTSTSLSRSRRNPSTRGNLQSDGNSLSRNLARTARSPLVRTRQTQNDPPFSIKINLLQVSLPAFLCFELSTDLRFPSRTDGSLLLDSISRSNYSLSIPLVDQQQTKRFDSLISRRKIPNLNFLSCEPHLFESHLAQLVTDGFFFFYRCVAYRALLVNGMNSNLNELGGKRGIQK